MNDGRSNEEALAAWAKRTLQQLPDRAAPSTLAPRVLAVLAKRQARPWYRQPWFQWPRPYQLLVALAALAVIGLGLWLVLPHSDAVSLASAKQAAAQFEPVREVSATAGILGSLGGALVLLLKSLSDWVLAGLVAAFAIFWSTTLGLGTACWRLAAGPRQLSS